MLCWSWCELAHDSVHRFPTRCQRLHIGSLKLSMMSVFTEQNSEIATNRGWFFSFKGLFNNTPLGTLWKNYTLSKTKQKNTKDPKQPTGHPSKK